MDYLNPTYEKHLQTLAYIAKNEFDIHLSTEKMIFDNSYRNKILSELNNLKSGGLGEYIKLLEDTPIYIKTTTQPFFLDELPDYSMPGKNEEIVVPSVKKSQSSSNKSMIIWFCGVCFVSLALLFVWFESQNFSVQPSHASVNQSESTDLIVQEVMVPDKQTSKTISEVSSLPVDEGVDIDEGVQETVTHSSPEKVAQKVVYAIQQRENTNLLEAALQVEKQKVEPNLIPISPVEKPDEIEVKSEKNIPLEIIVPTQVQSDNAIFTRIKTEIYSSSIKRFQLVEGIKDREPVGAINNIQFGNNPVAKIYAFSQANDLINDTLYYVWQLNGQELARVKVNVGSNYWRSYSTKRIPLNAHGDWSVTLKNQQGDVLAVSRFNY